MGMTLEEYRKNIYEDVTLPSGLVAKRKRLNLLGLMEALTAYGTPIENIASLSTVDAFHIADEIIERTIIEPKIVKKMKENEKDSSIAFDELDRDDYSKLILEAISEMNDVATSFREAGEDNRDTDDSGIISTKNE